MADTKVRSATKGATWRVLATLTTMLWVFIVSGNVAISLGIGAVDVVVKYALYYIHERAWATIQWGITP